MKLKKNIATLGAVLGLAGSLNAENFMRGARGPTDYQLDVRVAYSQRELGGSETSNFSETSILKYWNGDANGIFAYAAIPYKSIDNGKNSSNGIGDISLGVGPRGSFTNNIGSFHYLSSIGLNLPTGDENEVPRLGNGRTDIRANLGITYLTKSKMTELDASIEYTHATSSSASDNLVIGVAAGHQIGQHFRIGGGLIGAISLGGTQDGNYLLTTRGILRYTHSKRWHVEFWGDVDAASRNMPKGIAGTVAARINF